MRSRRTVVCYSDLLQAKAGDRAAQIGIVVVQCTDHVHDLPVEQPEITRIVRQDIIAQLIDETIKGHPRGSHRKLLLGSPPHAVDDVISFLPPPQKFEQKLDRKSTR